jgi:hypothetical protein
VAGSKSSPNGMIPFSLHWAGDTRGDSCPGRARIRRQFSTDKRNSHGRMAHGEYIDDFFAIGTDNCLIERSLSAVIKTCAKVKVPAKLSKVAYPGATEETLILGITLAGDGRATQIQPKLAALVEWIPQVIRFRACNKKEIERLLV